MPARNTVRMAYWIRLMKPTPSPPNTLLSIICASGTKPPMGVSESCMALTEPVVAAVVVATNRAVSAMSFLKPKPPVPAVPKAVSRELNTFIPPASRKQTSTTVSAK